ncbi:MAG: T9SS type A sorting domain-containing protein, partial [Muribaculaceae bacterium]|nr:T9SS type A sorting domain-containing protein [Muribaculaceae bacterium]
PRLPEAAGVEGIEVAAEQVSAYPLPASGTLHVRSSAAIENLDLYDTAGNLIMSVADSDELNLGATSPGLYLLRVRTAAGTSTLRIPVR